MADKTGGSFFQDYQSKQSSSSGKSSSKSSSSSKAGSGSKGSSASKANAPTLREWQAAQYAKYMDQHMPKYSTHEQHQYAQAVDTLSRQGNAINAYEAGTTKEESQQFLKEAQNEAKKTEPTKANSETRQTWMEIANAYDGRVKAYNEQEKAEQEHQAKLDAKASYEKTQQEIQKTQQEGQAKSQIWVDGIYMGEDKQVADEYAKRIKDLQDRAAKEREAAGDTIGLSTTQAVGANLEHGAWQGIMGLGQAGASQISEGVSSADSASILGKSAAENQAKYNQEYGDRLKSIWNGGGSVAGKMKDTLFSTAHFATQSFEKGAARNEAFYRGKQGLDYVLRNWVLPKVTGSDDAEANANWLTGKAYDATDKLTDKVSEWEPMQYVSTEKLQSAMKGSDKAAQLAGQVSDVIGRMLPSIAASWATRNPNVGRLMMAASAGGSAAEEAYRNGATAEQAYYIGQEKGFVEWATEGMFEGIGLLGGGALSDGAKRVLGDFALSKLGRVLLKIGDIFGENVEEAASDWASPGIDKAVLGQLPDDEEDLSVVQALLGQAPWTEQGAVTLLSTLVLGGISDISQNGVQRVSAEQAQEIIDIARNSGNERLANLANEYANLLEKRGSMGAKQFSEFAEATKKRVDEAEFNRKAQEKQQKEANPGTTNMNMFSDPATGLKAEQLALAKTLDSAAMDGMKTNAASWLSGKLNGTEAGGSILGDYINPEFISQLPDGAQQAAQAFANTENAEEAVQNIMNHAAELIGENAAEWDDAKSNAVAGYVLGTLSNLFQSGAEVNQARQQNIAAEAVEFAKSGMTIDEAIEAAKQTAQKGVTAKPKPVMQTTQPAQDSTGTAWTGDWSSWVEAALSGGALSDTDIDTIYRRAEARKAFEELKNISLEGMSEEEAKSYIGMAAGTMTKPVAQVQAQEQGTDQNNAQKAAESNPAREYVNSRQKAREAAEDGLNRTEANERKKPTKADKNVDKMILARLKERAKNGTRVRGTVSFEGGVLDDQQVAGVDQNNLTKQQKSAVRAAEAVADALGLDIVFFSDPAKDGNIKLGAWQGDKLYLNMDGAIRATKNGKSTSRFIVGATLSHELTHYLQKYDEAGYAQLRDFVEGTILEKDAASLETMIQQQLKMNPNMTPEEAMDEVVANACQEMLYDSEVVRTLARQNMNLFEKIVDIFDSVTNRINGAFAEVDTNDSDLYRAARLMKGETAELKRIWSHDLLTATENYQAAQGQEKTATEGGKVQNMSWSNNEPEIRAAIGDAVHEALQNRGKLEAEHNTIKFAKLEPRAVAMIYKASGIDITQKHVALNGDDTWHEFVNHSDPDKERGNGQVPLTEASVADAVATIYDPDIVEGLFQDSTITHRKSFAVAKKTPNGNYLIVEAVGGKNNPTIVPIQIMEIGQKKWNTYIGGGKTIGEMLYENNSVKLSALDTTANKNNRVIAAQFTSKDEIANTPHSPRSNKSIAGAAPVVKNPHAKFQQYNADGVGNDLDTLSQTKSPDGKTQFQVAAFENDEPEYRGMLAQAGWKESDIDELFERVNRAVDVIKENQEELDYAWEADIDDRAFNPVKQNSDKLYKVSQDFSTLCRKRILQGVIAGELSSSLQRGLTKEEGIAVRDALQALQAEGKQIEVACALCYVESARMRSQKAIQEFLNNREGSIRNYFANKEGKAAEAEAEAAERQAIADELGTNMVRGKGDDATMYDILDSKSATMKVIPTNLKKRIQDAKKAARASYPLTDAQQRIVDEANKLPVTAFTTPEGLQELAKNPDTRDIFNAFVLKVSAASKSKGIENDTWWRAGDSKNISDLLIEQMNAENGLRTQSWSDFQVKHLMDYIAATIELSTRKAKQHAYTKVLDYVELMGDTGVMINMSLIPTAEFNGKLEYDDVEGFKYKEAMRMREKFPDTAGTICIGMNDEQIHQLLESDEIDYVIPYHQSGMSKATRAAMHIPAWKDFQSFQGEKKLSGADAKANAQKYGVELLDESDSKWHEGPSFSEWFDLKTAQETAAKYGKSGKYGVMTGGYMAMQEAAEKYKRLCAERGLQPKFSYGKADFSEDANYWKLLIDRKMVNNKTGEIIEQKAIQPNFDMDTIQRILDDELERYGTVKADQDEAIQRVTEAFLSGKVKGGMDSEAIAEAMQKPLDNLAITAATQGQTYNPDVFDPVETLVQKQKQAGKQTTAKPADSADILADVATGKQTGKKGPKLNWNDRSGEETKTSEYFSNTNTKNGKAKDLNETDFKYVPIPEQKSIQRAARKIANNYDQVLSDLYGSRTWLSEQVDAAWLISDKLKNEWDATGTKEAYDAWNRFEQLIQDHATESGAALQAFAKQSRPGSAAVLRVAQERINAMREAKAEAEKAGKGKGTVSEEALKKAEEKTRDFARRMGKLEFEIDEKIQNGTGEEEARASAKNAYLDLIDEINTYRHTGLMQDASKHEAARQSKEVKKLNTKFRKMLENESMDYIMRFAACDLAGISADTQYEGKQDFRKRLNTWQKLAQLTGTGTWLRNGVGNGSFGLVDVLSANNPITILADMFVKENTGKRSSGFELGIADKVARDAAAHALRRSVLEIAANIDLDMDSDATKYDMSRTRTYDPDGKVGERLMSRWEQWNGYMLNSSDAWFKGMASGSAEAAIRRANRWDKGNLTKAERASLSKEQAEKLAKKRQAEIDETVRQIAEYRTFQNDSMAAKGADKIREGLNRFGAGLIGRKWQQGQFGLGTALMPYTKVPTNLAVKSVEFSPLGALNGLREMVQVMNDPKATMAQQNKAVTDFGRGVTGTILIATLAQVMKQIPFFKDWDAEDDKDVKAQNKAEGKYGMEINLDLWKRWASGDKDTTWRNDDRTLDISSMEPLNQLITTASLIAEGESIPEAFWKSSRDSVLNMPALQTLSNIEQNFRYTDTPDEGLKTAINTAASTAGNVAGGMIPAPIKHAATVTDSKVRDTRGNTPIERSVNQFKSGVPGLRQTLPVKRDAFGNEMGAGDFATRVANTYDAFKHTQVNQSDVSRELERLREGTGESRMPSRNGPSTLQINGEKLKLNNSERVDYQSVQGQEYGRDLEELFDKPYYKNADADTQDALVAAVEEYSKDTTKDFYADYKGIDYEGEYAGIRDLDDPVGYIGINKRFNLANTDGEYDVIDTLVGPIRRMSKGDQDYLREKNSTAMSYYDYLTPNAYGYKVGSAEAVHSLKEQEKANAEKRGVKQASGQDTFEAIRSGVRKGSIKTTDVNAMMTKQASNGNYDVTKGRAAVYLAAVASGYNVKDALEIAAAADINEDGEINEKAVYIKGQKEGTKTLKKAGIDSAGWDAFNAIMYPYKVK